MNRPQSYSIQSWAQYNKNPLQLWQSNHVRVKRLTQAIGTCLLASELCFAFTVLWVSPQSQHSIKKSLRFSGLCLSVDKQPIQLLDSLTRTLLQRLMVLINSTNLTDSLTLTLSTQWGYNICVKCVLNAMRLCLLSMFVSV